MLTNLIREVALVPSMQQEFGQYAQYFDAARDTLLAGRHLRGRTRTRVRAAIGHALSFTTWRSLTREQGLTDADAVDLMIQTIRSAAPAA